MNAPDSLESPHKGDRGSAAVLLALVLLGITLLLVTGPALAEVLRRAA